MSSSTHDKNVLHNRTFPVWKLPNLKVFLWMYGESWHGNKQTSVNVASFECIVRNRFQAISCKTWHNS